MHGIWSILQEILNQMSSSELWPRKVELMCLIQKMQQLPWVFTHTNRACTNTHWKNFTALKYLLDNGLYKITTESIKLVLNIKQFNTGSNLIVPPPRCTGSVLFFFTTLLRHSMHSTEVSLSIFSLDFTMKSKTM